MPTYPETFSLFFIRGSLRSRPNNTPPFIFATFEGATFLSFVPITWDTGYPANPEQGLTPAIRDLFLARCIIRYRPAAVDCPFFPRIFARVAALRMARSPCARADYDARRGSAPGATISMQMPQRAANTKPAEGRCY